MFLTLPPCPFPAPLLPSGLWGELASEEGQHTGEGVDGRGLWSEGRWVTDWRRLKGLLSTGKVFVCRGRPTSRAPSVWGRDILGRRVLCGDVSPSPWLHWPPALPGLGLSTPCTLPA